jgi:hypothetical protein
MSRSKILCSAFGAAMAAAMAFSTPAHAIDPGCYPADVVRNATWLAEGPEKQFSIIVGERANGVGQKNFFTASADGSIGYNIEGNGKVDDGESGLLCIRAKYQNVRVNTVFSRPSWVAAPAGSPNDRYLNTQAEKLRTSVIFGATTIVRGKDGREYRGPQLLVTKSDVPIAGQITGAAITSDTVGEGYALFAMGNLRTNANFDALANAQRVQTASLAIK